MYRFIIIFFSLVFSQNWFNHPELVWNTLESDHFIIHYHNDTERTARETSTVAESIYFQVTSYYEFEPNSKTHIIIKDINDYSNGAAYFFDNKIIISALPLDFRLRGSHRWLQNVITHEFTHIVQIGASMKASMRFPLAFLQIMGYEQEKREDVLYGYPNTIASYPIPNVSVPPWLAEGTAQFMYPGATYDFWDTNRDMILRDRTINDNLLSFNQMNSFGNKGMGNESVYSQGFAFCNYLTDRFGDNILPDISETISSPFNYSINRVLKNTTGISGEKLFVDWKISLEEKYYNFKDLMLDDIIAGRIIESKGDVNILPSWSPDGESFAFLSNRNNESFFQTDLYIFQLQDSSSTLIAKSVKTAVTWKNSYTLIYSKLSEPDYKGSIYFDIYSYNVIDDDEERLTYGSRLSSPIFIPNQNKIVAINNHDGTSNILISDIDSIDFKQITNYDDGTYISSIDIMNNVLVFDLIDNHGRDIYSLNLEDFSVDPLSLNNYDEQDPAKYDDGMISSKDESGIFNLYINTDKQSGYITNVLGGAFMPSVSIDGKVLYSLYDDASYNIAILDTIVFIPDNKIGYNNIEFKYPKYGNKIIDLNNSESVVYKTKMSKLSFMPKLLIDYNTVKPGLYCSSVDLLDKLSLFGAVSINNKEDLDVFLNFEYSKLAPTIYASLFWITRHQTNTNNYYNNKGLILDNISLNYDLTFLLFAGEIGARYRYKNYKFWLDYSYSNYRQHINQHIQQQTQDESLNFYGDAAFDYYRGHNISMSFENTKRDRGVLANILPRKGFYQKVKLSYEWNSFMDGFAINEEYSTFGANFKPNDTFRILLDLSKNFNPTNKFMVGSTVSAHLGWISKPDIDDFFYFFNGGERGLRGYTFYEESLTGPTKIIFSSTTRIPIFTEKNYKFINFDIQNLVAGVVVQCGSAPDLRTIDDIIDIDIWNYKFSSGLEFRLNGFSFYSYPTAIEYSCHVPIFDNNNYDTKQYLKILFSFQ